MSSANLSASNINDNLGDRINSGVIGAVYSLKNDSRDVVKEIRLDGLKAASVRAFKDHMRVLPTLDHPNIIKCSQTIQTGDFAYIRMKRYSDSLESMNKRYKRKYKKVPDDVILTVTAQVAAALAYLHSWRSSQSPIVHRELKPTNILLDDTGAHFVVTDVGFCREWLAFEQVSTDPRLYAAPETISRGEHSFASDMWSLGAIIFEMATGSRLPSMKDRPVEGWEPDLGKVENDLIKKLIKGLLVIEPSGRLKAQQVLDMAGAGGAAGPQGDARFDALEAAQRAQSAEIRALKELAQGQMDQFSAFKSSTDRKFDDIMAMLQQIISKTGGK